MGEKECVYCLNKRVINSQSRQNVAVLGMIWGWLGCVVWSWFVFWVLGNTFVFNVSDITVISVSGVGNNLGTAIGKSNTVFTSDNITVTVFIGGKVSLGVVILNSITILVNSWAIIGWFVIRSWLVVSWSWVYDWFVYNWGYIWSWLVYNRGYIGSWFVYNWGVIRSWFVDDWGMIRSWSWVVYWSWLVISWGGMVSWGGMIRSGMMDSMVDWVWDGVMDSWMSISGGMYWYMCWSMNGGTVFFTSIRVVYVLGSGMGLGCYNGVVSTMGFVDGMADGGGITVFDCLVA